MSVIDRFGRYSIVAGVCLIAGLLLGDLKTASMQFLAAVPSPIEARVLSSFPADVDLSSERPDAIDEATDLPTETEVVQSVSEIAELDAGPVWTELESPFAQQGAYRGDVAAAEERHELEVTADAPSPHHDQFATEKADEAADPSEDQTATMVEPAETLTAKKDLPVSISALSMLKSQSSIMPATCEDGKCPKPGKTLGTSLQWADTPSDAYRDAGEDEKLVFLIHVSGNFEIPGFT